jgi:serine/threonine protein kinase
VDEVIVEEICKEVSILKELSHPNIIRYFNSFADRSSVYIVMELLDGYSLADYIISQSEKKQRVKESIVWQVLIQLTAALRYLHVEKRIIHRDLAPGNVLISGD